MCNDQVLATKRQLADEILAVIDGTPAPIALMVLGLDRQRVSELRSDKIKRFSVDKLIWLLAKLNRRVDIQVVNIGPARVKWIHVVQEIAARKMQSSRDYGSVAKSGPMALGQAPRFPRHRKKLPTQPKSAAITNS